MTREDLYNVTKELLQNNQNLAIQAATGVGKSKIAVDFCKEYANKHNNTCSILIFVAERAHINNWIKELNKWWNYNNNITIVCYASMKKYYNTQWDIIIFDEAHHLNSELRLDVFDSLNANYKLFLSATLQKSLILRLEASCGPIATIKMGLQDAFNSNILPEPKIKLIPLTLNNTVASETIIEEWGKKDKRLVAKCTYAERWKYLKDKKKVPNGTLIISCTQQQKYDYLCSQFEYYKKRYMFSRNEAIKNKWLQSGAKRKVYLGLLKTNIAKQLLEKVKDKRFICFCTNIEQAEILGNKNAIHSKKKNTDEIINKFNNKEINSLFAVGMLQEGMNLNDIQAGIIVQLDGEERAFIQKFGRALRADSPVQYILYYKDTRDEEYLQKALENIDTKYIEKYESNN